MTLHVETTGAGAPLVLVHGWGFHSGIWEGFAQRLGERFRVHRLDLPGHGRSSEAASAGLDETVDEVARWVPDGSIVCGWSMGGMVAQRLALRHPRKTRALALFSTTPCFLRRDDWIHGMAASTLDDFAHDLEENPRTVLERFVNLNAIDAPTARETARSIARRLAQAPLPSHAALTAGLALLRRTDLRAEMGLIGTPTVVLHGTRDRIVPIGAGRALAASISGARLVELPRSAHLPFVTDADASLEALVALDG